MPLEGREIAALSGAMLRLDVGDLASLRRMDVHGPGAAAFWRLAAKCGFIAKVGQTEVWMRLVRIMAILVPRGEPEQRGPLHQPKTADGIWRGLGALLCDGGHAGAVIQRPFVSEARLMRFLAEPAAKRAETLERFARMLAPKRDRQTGLNCNDIAALLLATDPTPVLRRIARDYYQRLDAISRQSTKEEAS